MNWRPSCSRPSGRMERAGFSLLELLLVMAILIILFTIYWGPNSASRQRGLQASCQRNLQKVYIALQIYANEHGSQFPAVSGARRPAEPLDLLVPKYDSDTSAFICPGTGKASLPAGQSIRARSISYAYYMGGSLTNTQLPLLTDQQVDSQPKAPGQMLYSPDGKPPGNNHGKFGGNVLFGDGHAEISPPRAPFALPVSPGTVLLNP